jgi:hypothetical protein
MDITVVWGWCCSMSCCPRRMGLLLGFEDGGKRDETMYLWVVGWMLLEARFWDWYRVPTILTGGEEGDVINQLGLD